MKALICGCGGSKGAAQIGVIECLLEQNPNLDYQIYAGSSVGALNCLQLATEPLNRSFPHLKHIWLEKVKGNRSVWNHHVWRYILLGIIIISIFIILAFITFIVSAPKWLTIILGFCALFSLYIPYYSLNNSHSIYDTKPLRNLIEENIDVSKLKQNDKILKVGVISFTTGKYKSIDKTHDNLVDWIMASSAFPIFFPMPYLDGEYWTDGGIVDIALLDEVIALGATEVDIIITNPITAGDYFGLPGILKQILRNIDIMSAEILRNNIEVRCRADNVKIRLFMPERQLTSNSLNFDPRRIERMYKEGREIAQQVIYSKKV